MNILDKLDKINTATKYSSIPTYHEINNGTLNEQNYVKFPDNEYVTLTEKVDGVCSRIILLYSWDYFIGSRETLLHAAGDIIHNKELNIVDTLLPTANSLADNGFGPDDPYTIITVYGEVYGGKIGGQWKNYTTDPYQTGFRIFDIAVINNVDSVFQMSLAELSIARDHNNIQTWYTEEQLQNFSDNTELPLAKRLGDIKSQNIPLRLEEMHAFLSDALPHTQESLSDKALGNPEGIVLRTSNRSVIAKARFEDYDKTLKKLAAK